MARGGLRSTSQVWATLRADRRAGRVREALEAGDFEILWGLLEHYLIHRSRAGAHISAHTLAAYRAGLRQFFAYLGELGLSGGALAEAVLEPSEDLGTAYLRYLERAGKSPATVNARRACLAAFYRALRWARATGADPLAEVPSARDPTPRHEKRTPYSEAEFARLLEAASPVERALLLLAGYQGLRASELVGLRWEQIDLSNGRMGVVGKGGKAASLPLARAVAEALLALPERSGPVLPYGSATNARRALRRLAQRAGVPYRGLHALRHYAGTRIYRATQDIHKTARLLRHANIATSAIYAKLADDDLRRALDS